MRIPSVDQLEAPEVTVLVVDDVEENLLEISTLLDRPGRRVLTCGTGEEALELVGAHDLAAVVLDIHLPGMSGFEVAERMRAAPATVHVPIVFVSAVMKAPHDMFVGYELGAVDYILRPFDAHILRSKIDVLCELWTQRHLIEEKNELLERHLAEIRTLRGLIPVCARCHRIRDDDGFWERCETYVSRHTEAEFTHGICEECAEKLYPDE